jgi:hypothetical protein
LVPAFGVVDAVQNASVDCGHTASDYFWGKNKTFGFETRLPLGVNQRQHNAWMYHPNKSSWMRPSVPLPTRPATLLRLAGSSPLRCLALLDTPGASNCFL